MCCHQQKQKSKILISKDPVYLLPVGQGQAIVLDQVDYINITFFYTFLDTQ